MNILWTKNEQKMNRKWAKKNEHKINTKWTQNELINEQKMNKWTKITNLFI